MLAMNDRDDCRADFMKMRSFNRKVNIPAARSLLSDIVLQRRAPAKRKVHMQLMKSGTALTNSELLAKLYRKEVVKDPGTIGFMTCVKNSPMRSCRLSHLIS